jgi:hypothetical protein
MRSESEDRKGVLLSALAQDWKKNIADSGTRFCS